MSLSELACLIGRTKGHLSKLERNLTPASDETVNRITQALQVPPDAITRKE
jgi:transcriptional regulator with XRE-family HTH domain